MALRQQSRLGLTGLQIRRGCSHVFVTASRQPGRGERRLLSLLRGYRRKELHRFAMLLHCF